MKPQAVDTVYFAFENDFVDTFRCIPMIVRYKLDTCGIKLKLPEWVKLSVDESGNWQPGRVTPTQKSGNTAFI
jgi:hypothetical protein